MARDSFRVDDAGYHDPVRDLELAGPLLQPLARGTVTHEQQHGIAWGGGRKPVQQVLEAVPLAHEADKADYPEGLDPKRSLGLMRVGKRLKSLQIDGVWRYGHSIRRHAFRSYIVSQDGGYRKYMISGAPLKCFQPACQKFYLEPAEFGTLFSQRRIDFHENGNAQRTPD